MDELYLVHDAYDKLFEKALLKEGEYITIDVSPLSVNKYIKLFVNYRIRAFYR